MSHILILIYDENGNQIGEYYPGHEAGEEGGNLAAEPPKMVLFMDKIIDIHGIKAKEKDKD